MKKLCSYLSSHCGCCPHPEFFGNAEEETDSKEEDEEEESEDEDYSDEGGEDIDLADFEDIDEAELHAATEEEAEKMSSKKKPAAKKKAAAKTPPRKAKAAVDDVSEGMESMSIGSKSRYSMNAEYPLMLYDDFFKNKKGGYVCQNGTFRLIQFDRKGEKDTHTFLGLGGLTLTEEDALRTMEDKNKKAESPLPTSHLFHAVSKSFSNEPDEGEIDADGVLEGAGGLHAMILIGTRVDDTAKKWFLIQNT